MKCKWAGRQGRKCNLKRQSGGGQVEPDTCPSHVPSLDTIKLFTPASSSSFVPFPHGLLNHHQPDHCEKRATRPGKGFCGLGETDAPTPSSGSRNNRALETTREIQKFRGKFNFQPKPSIGVVKNYKLKSTPSSGSWNKQRHLAAKKDTN